jgi:hypothetical protein
MAILAMLYQSGDRMKTLLAKEAKYGFALRCP